MRLKSVQVTNFKSILDSTQFEAGPVTCLVGKNEAGKTAMLEALYKLNPVAGSGQFNVLLEYPRRYRQDYEHRAKQQADPALKTTWELEAQDVRSVEQAFGPGVLKSTTVTVAKGYDNTRKWTIDYDERAVIKGRLGTAQLDRADRSRYSSVSTVQELVERLQERDGPSDAETRLLQGLTDDFGEGGVPAALRNHLAGLLPKFLYFSRYHIMRGRVSIDDIVKRQEEDELDDSDRVFLALLDLVSTTPEAVVETPSSEQLIADLEAASSHISDQIFRYWTQNRNLTVQFVLHEARPKDPPPFDKGQVFETRILNTRHMVTLNFDERSSGFVWFFSFLVWFSQIKRQYGERIVVLLDEPGLGLHAKAQQDLLRYISEQLEPHYQVLYTTHSPFMVDPSKLLRVRTVEDVVKVADGRDEFVGTKVGDRVLSTDADTLFPLQAALGYEITQTLFVGTDNLLVEGPSDLLYLDWFSQRLKETDREHLDPRWVIAPCGGVDKVPAFMSLFGGNRLNVAVLLDLASGQKSKTRDLRRSGLLQAGHVFTADQYVGAQEADVEDMIGRATYMALVNRTYGLTDQNAMDPSLPPSQGRVVAEVEEHFRQLPPDVPEFSHYAPAEYLARHAPALEQELPELDLAFGRFERFFSDLNKCLR